MNDELQKELREELGWARMDYPEIPLGEDIAEVCAGGIHRGDYAETEMWAVVQLTTGAFVAIEAGCDTTGWGCQSHAEMSTHSTCDAAIQSVPEKVREAASITEMWVGAMRRP